MSARWFLFAVYLGWGTYLLLRLLLDGHLPTPSHALLAGIFIVIVDIVLI